MVKTWERTMRSVVVSAAAVLIVLTLAPTLSGAQTGFSGSAAIALPAGAPRVASDYFDSMSCAGVNECVGLASASPPLGGGNEVTSLATTLSGGAWSDLAPVGLAPEAVYAPLDSLSCWTSEDCTAAGFSEGGLPLVATETTGTWSGATAAPAPPAVSTAVLRGVWCAGAGSCEAVGETYPPAPARIFDDVESSGVWQPSVVLPIPEGDPASSTYEFHPAISCTAVGDCILVGSVDRGSRTSAFAQEEVDGVWESPTLMTVRGASQVELNSISCVPSGFCAAVGDALVGGTHQPIGAFRAAGRWHLSGLLSPPQFSPSLTAGELNSVSCVARVTCVAVGEMAGVESNNGPFSIDPHGHPVAFTIVGSSWTRGELMPLPRSAGLVSGGADLQAVTCFSSVRCVALGSSAPIHAARYRYAPPALPFVMELRPVAPITSPGPPTHLGTTIQLYGGLALDWGYPRSDGGTPIASFVVIARTAGLRAIVRRTAGLSVSLGGLPAHRSYVVTVRARNLAGRFGPVVRIVIRR
jgi:hypothetical protein